MTGSVFDARRRVSISSHHPKYARRANAQTGEADRTAFSACLIVTCPTNVSSSSDMDHIELTLGQSIDTAIESRVPTLDGDLDSIGLNEISHHMARMPPPVRLIVMVISEVSSLSSLIFRTSTRPTTTWSMGSPSDRWSTDYNRRPKSTRAPMRMWRNDETRMILKFTRTCTTMRLRSPIPGSRIQISTPDPHGGLEG